MLLERRRMSSVLVEQEALARELIEASSARYASGTGSQADILRAEVELARVHGTQQALVAQARAAEAMLNASMGREAAERVADLVHVPTLDLPLTAHAAVERALSRRPEVVAGEAEVKRAKAEVQVMGSRYKPMATVRLGRASTMAEGPGAFSAGVLMRCTNCGPTMENVKLSSQVFAATSVGLHQPGMSSER